MDLPEPEGPDITIGWFFSMAIHVLIGFLFSQVGRYTSWCHDGAFLPAICASWRAETIS